jgi:fatty acid desaturase
MTTSTEFSDSETSKLILAELREIRREMLTDPAISSFVSQHRRTISGRDAIVCLTAFLGGLLIQISALEIQHSLGLGFVLFVCALGLLVQLIGMTGFSSLMHECWHRYAVSSGVLNEFIGRWIVSPMFLLDFDRYRERHFQHHRHVGQDGDPDSPAWQKTLGEFVVDITGKLTIAPKLAAIFFKRHTVKQTGGPRLSRKALVAILIFHGLWAGTCFISSPILVITAYVVPLILVSSLLTLREYREHFYLEDGRLVTCDIDCPLIERLLIAGGYFNFHASHHVFPELPQRQLPKLIRMIYDSPELHRRYIGKSLLLAQRKSYFGRAYRIYGEGQPDETRPLQHAS